MATGKGPTNLAFDGTQRYAYVTNSKDNNVSQFAVDAAGALTPLSVPTVATGTSPTQIAITY